MHSERLSASFPGCFKIAVRFFCDWQLEVAVLPSVQDGCEAPVVAAGLS